MGSLPSSLQNAQLWPIKAQGAVTRLNPLGDPDVESVYHTALEQGRFAERNLADANHWLLQKKQQFEQHIQSYLNLNKVVVDGQLPDSTRPVKYIADSIIFLKQVAAFQQSIIKLVQACTQNLGMLASIEQNMLAMVQSNLNAITNILNNICNWGLPDLPAIPNFFSDTVWNWNGFNFFPLAAFKPNIKFDANFAFSQCNIHLPNINIFRNYPSSVQTYSGLNYGSEAFAPPLNGIIPDTGTNLADPNFIAQMQAATVAPYYLPQSLTPTGTQTAFNPNTSMLGAVPDPNTIISNYQMPSQTYHDNIVSILPAIRQNTIEPSDADYASPNLVLRQTNLQRDLAQFVTLEQVVASNYDPYVTSAWLFYLDLTRTGRSGTWLPNFEAVYEQYITPSIISLATNAVPWNNVLGGSGLRNTPTDIPLIDVVKALSGSALTVVLWRLSYIEASLLGYTRAKDWDASQDANYLAGTTGSDLDYQPTTTDSTKTTTVILGALTALFPVTCTFPSAITAVLNEVIAGATIDIQNDIGYQSPRLGNRFVFDQFAEATKVDRFSQFWRDFNTNLNALLVQDPYLVQFAVTYIDTLNGAVNPLADTTAYAALQSDVATRNRTWVRGTPVLPIPKAPVVAFQNDSIPTTGNSGWQGTIFNPEAFLSRPDIQAQPIPVQIAMLRTNLSYAGISQWRDQVSAQIQDAIVNTTAVLNSVQQFGFEVEDDVVTTAVPTGSVGAQVLFDKIDFDLTGNVTLPDTFVLQNTGEYAVFGGVNWDGPAVDDPPSGSGGIRTVTVFQNGTPIVIQSSTPTQAGPLTLSFSTTGNFTEGDVITLVATHTLGETQHILPGSFFSMVQIGGTSPSPVIPPVATSGTQTFIAGATIAPLVAFQVKSDGTIIPIDPTVVVTDGPSGTIIAPNPDGISLNSGVIGGQILAGTTYGGVFQVANSGFTIGGLLYVGLNGVLTQDYSTLVTDVQWIICVGRVIATDTFIYEPHVPTRFVIAF